MYIKIDHLTMASRETTANQTDTWISQPRGELLCVIFGITDELIKLRSLLKQYNIWLYRTFDNNSVYKNNTLRVLTLAVAFAETVTMNPAMLIWKMYY